MMAPRPLAALLLFCSAAAGADDADVVVVGAGWAGISAAQQLAAAGRSVLLLEARGEVGGRSRTLTPFGNPLDMGSSWTADNKANPIMALAKKYSAKTISTGGSAISYLTKAGLFSAEGKRLTGAALAEFGVDAEAFDTELYLNNKTVKRDWPLDRALNATFDRFKWSAAKRTQLRGVYELEGVDNAAALSEFSLDNLDEIEACSDFDGDALVFQDGYGALARSVADDLPASVTLLLNAPVAAVHHSDGGVTVQTADGRVFTAAHVVITVSLGLLQRRAIDVRPPLAAPTQRAIDNAGWGTVDKVWLEFPVAAALPWAPLREDYMFILQPQLRARYNMFVDWHTITGLPQLLSFCSGDCADFQLNATDSEVAGAVMANLRKMFPDAPEPSRAHVVRWRADNSSYGSYSFLRIGERAADRKAMLVPSGRVWLAGEAIGTVMNGFTHGAWMSGLSAANAIVQDVPAERAADFRDSIARAICPSSSARRSSKRIHA